MSEDLTFVQVGTGDAARGIAVRRRNGKTPGLMWLGGFKSDMGGTKAVALDQWAAAEGRACVRFDYSGHGDLGGAFIYGTISRWLEEAVAVFDVYCAGPQVLVGSSMGGWLALLLARELKRRVPAAASLAGLVLIAPAVDFTEELMWKRFPPEVKREIEANGCSGASVAIFRPTLSDHESSDRGWPSPSAAGRVDRDRLSGAHSSGRAGSRRAVAARGRACLAVRRR